MSEENSTIEFNDTILFVDKITHVTKSKQIIHNSGDKLRNELGVPVYEYVITVHFVNGNKIDFVNLSHEDLKSFQNLIQK